MTVDAIEIPVLIVGGGPVGLTASMLLSQHGVRSLLVERHPGTAIHPKARGINVRTMEIYHQCGVEAAIRAAGLPPERTGLTVWARSQAGEEIERRVPGRATPAAMALSPVRACLCAQDDLEPVLRRFAEILAPGALRFSTELTSLEQDGDGVRAVIVDRTSGAETRVRARHAIAADGAQSGVRRGLGIAMHGREGVYDSVNILLRADLTPWTRHRPAALYFIEQPEFRGTFLTINGTDRWGFLVNGLSTHGLSATDFTPERSLAMVRAAAGVPDLPVEILGIAPWVASAKVAERFRAGHVFLAGDAAHEMPPTGGFGLNTGVQDVHNLAWKLAAVLHGWATPALLDTYEAERVSLGRTITEQSLANSLSMGRGSRPEPGVVLPRREFLNEQGMIFGASYDSTAVIPDGTPPPAVANPVTDYVPSARPGSRAPHVWLERNGERLGSRRTSRGWGPAVRGDLHRISTIDLVGRGFVLFTGPAAAASRDAISSASSRPPLEVLAVGRDIIDVDGQWRDVYGVDDDGAVLVRPDGHVAWRGRLGAAAGALAKILGH